MRSSSQGATESDGSDTFTKASVNSNSEGFDATEKRSGHSTSVGTKKSRPGKKRGARSVGRYPFLTKAKEYVNGRMLADTTKEREERNIRMLNKMVMELKKRGMIDETNPAKFTKREVVAIEEAMRLKKLGGSTIEKYRGLIEGVCTYHGNGIYEEMKKKGVQFSMRVPKEVRSLSSKELEDIQDAAIGIKGWTGEVCRFLVTILPNSGLRPSELRLAHLKDLNLEKMFFKVKNPKGKGKYGRERKAAILPQARPAIVAYLKARKAYLEKNGYNESVEPLVPSVRGRSGPQTYSSQSFRKCLEIIKSNLPEDFEQFSLKTFRATYLQIIMKDHPELLEDVSYSMGHSSTVTTQRYYRRIEEDKTVERIHNAFARPLSEQAGAKNPLIDKNFEVTGYA